MAIFLEDLRGDLVNLELVTTIERSRGGWWVATYPKILGDTHEVESVRSFFSGGYFEALVGRLLPAFPGYHSVLLTGSKGEKAVSRRPIIGWSVRDIVVVPVTTDMEHNVEVSSSSRTPIIEHPDGTLTRGDEQWGSLATYLESINKAGK